MNNYQALLNQIQEAGFGEYVVSSYEEAQANTRKKNIVLVQEEHGQCSVYLTYKYQNQFGELVCWVSDEFEEEEDLVSIVANAIQVLYSSSEDTIDQLIANHELPSAFQCPFEV